MCIIISTQIIHFHYLMCNQLYQNNFGLLSNYLYLYYTSIKIKLERLTIYNYTFFRNYNSVYMYNIFFLTDFRGLDCLSFWFLSFVVYHCLFPHYFSRCITLVFTRLCKVYAESCNITCTCIFKYLIFK